METVLEVTGLTKRYHSFTLKDVSFSLEPGYILGITGRNGAGKTTLINQLIHPETASGGSVIINGIDAKRDPVKAKQEIGVLMEEQPFLSDMTLEMNGELLGGFYDRFDRNKFHEYLKRFESLFWQNK